MKKFFGAFILTAIFLTLFSFFYIEYGILISVIVLISVIAWLTVICVAALIVLAMNMLFDE